MTRHTPRCQLAVLAPFLAATWLASAALADDGDLPRRAANLAASLDDADPVSSWVDETVSEQPAAEPVAGSGGRLILRRSGARPPAKAKGAEPLSPDGVFETSVFEMAWPMLVVLVVISACVYAFKRWVPRASRPGGGDAVKILARHYLSGKQSLCLVRTGRRVLLVGITPERINTLSEMTDAEEVAALVGTAERGSPGSFTKMFGKITDRDLADEAGELQGDGRRFLRRDRGIQEDLVVSAPNLADTGKNVQDLIERVRSLSVETDAQCGLRPKRSGDTTRPSVEIGV